MLDFHLLLGINHQHMTTIKALLRDRDLVITLIQVRLGATRLADFLWVFRAGPPDKPDTTDEDGEE